MAEGLGRVPQLPAGDRLLEQLSVDASWIPATTAGRADRLRTLIAHRNGPVLIFLDDVREAQQVRWILPNTSDSVVLATSEVPMGELAMEGAEFLAVEPLDAGAGRALIERGAGAGRSTDEASVARLVELCEGLPLALGAASAQLAANPGLPVADLVTELADERLRFGRLTGDLPVVTAAFEVAYRDLPGPAGPVYRLLGLLPGATAASAGLEFGADLIAAASALEEVTARAALEQLRRRGLVEATAESGRFRVHGLVRSHALHLAAAAPDDPAAVLAAIARHQLALVARADRVLFASRLRFTPDAVAAQAGRSPFLETGEKALAWLDRENASLVATIRALVEQNRAAFDELAWMLAESLTALFLHHRYLASWYESGTLGARAAERAGQIGVAARLMSLTSRAMTDLGRHEEAANATAKAVSLAEALVEQSGEIEDARRHRLLLASVWEFRGRVLERSDANQAVAAYRRARDLNQAIGERRGEALALFFLGNCLFAGGEDEQSAVSLEEARELFTTAVAGGPDRRMLARTRAALGRVLARQGHRDAAIEALTGAVSELDAIGAWSYQAASLEELAELVQARGQADLAQEYRARGQSIREHLAGA